MDLLFEYNHYHNTMNKKNIFWLLSIYMLTCTPVSAQVLFEKDCQTEIFVGKEEKRSSTHRIGNPAKGREERIRCPTGSRLCSGT